MSFIFDGDNKVPASFIYLVTMYILNFINYLDIGADANASNRLFLDFQGF